MMTYENLQLLHFIEELLGVFLEIKILQPQSHNSEQKQSLAMRNKVWLASVLTLHLRLSRLTVAQV
jgi:hypothetical protein